MISRPLQSSMATQSKMYLVMVIVFFSAMLIGMKESGIQATSPAELRDNVINFLKTADRDTVAHYQGFMTNPTHVDHTNHNNGNDAEMQEDVD